MRSLLPGFLVGDVEVLRGGFARQVDRRAVLAEQRLRRRLLARTVRTGCSEALDPHDMWPPDRTKPATCGVATCLDVGHADGPTIAGGGIGLEQDTTHRYGLSTKSRHTLDDESLRALCHRLATGYSDKGDEHRHGDGATENCCRAAVRMTHGVSRLGAPLARLPRLRYTAMSIVSLTNDTEPSAIANVAPRPACSLPNVVVPGL